jgi:hypothetical protein
MHDLSIIQNINSVFRPRPKGDVLPPGEYPIDQPAAYQHTDPSDFLIRDEGSIYLLYPQSADADSWINQHISEDATWFGSALVIGHRYVEDILRAIVAEGLGVRR